MGVSVDPGAGRRGLEPQSRLSSPLGRGADRAPTGGRAGNATTWVEVLWQLRGTKMSGLSRKVSLSFKKKKNPLG